MNPLELVARPEALPLLAVAPLAWWALRELDRSRERHLRETIGPRVAALAPHWAPSRRRVRRALVAAGLLLAALAVAKPVWGDTAQSVEQRGVDIVVCLDVSRSMLARDQAPTRLAAAQREIRTLAERTRGDRLALVVFAGEARVAVPLTQDAESFAQLASRADTVSVGRGGTDLGAALEAALRALAGTTGEHETVLLLTDGEDHAERGLRVAERARERGIAVHCVGFGSALGSKIAVSADGGAGGETFVRDAEGREVVSAMDPASLRRVADATGGAFVEAMDRPRALVELYDERIAPMARKAFEADEQRDRQDRFQWPLGAAFALWVLELALSDRRRR